MNLKNPVKPQKHREHREKQSVVMPRNITCRVKTICQQVYESGLSLCLCASVSLW